MDKVSPSNCLLWGSSLLPQSPSQSFSNPNANPCRTILHRLWQVSVKAPGSVLLTDPMEAPLAPSSGSSAVASCHLSPLTTTRDPTGNSTQGSFFRTLPVLQNGPGARRFVSSLSNPARLKNDSRHLPQMLQSSLGTCLSYLRRA
jgi:uncharacterized protein YfaQ (DUF2300 family)